MAFIVFFLTGYFLNDNIPIFQLLDVFKAQLYKVGVNKLPSWNIFLNLGHKILELFWQGKMFGIFTT